MSVPTLQEAAPEYFRMFAGIEVAEKRQAEVARIAQRIVANEARYTAVAAKLPGVPWCFIGITHQMECELDFTKHLHNGDLLRARTVNVPAGRPLGKPPFRWEDSAWDAMYVKKLNAWPDWSVAGMLYQFERFNGWGYRVYRNPSPYLWSGSQYYKRGKFIADHVYDANATSAQIGAAVLLHQLCKSGAIALRAELNPASRPVFT